MSQEDFRFASIARAEQLQTDRDGSQLPPLVRVVQTCRACPSQWDAWDETGQYYYLRYRGGRGTAETAASVADYGDLDTAAMASVANFNHGDPLDGSLSLHEFLTLAGMRLAPDASVR